MNIEVLTADDWRTLRRVRLRALADSPRAFISDYDIERSWTESRWRHSFIDALWVVTVARRRTVGVARAVGAPERPSDERHLESVWVDPRHRRTGVFRTLVRYLVEREPDVRDWLVWVLDDNASARAVYERLGFEPTGERQALPDDSGRIEERLRLRHPPRFR